MAVSHRCVVEWQCFWVAIFVQTGCAFTTALTFVTFAARCALATALALATLTAFCALTTWFALLTTGVGVATLGALATLFTCHAFVACFCARFGLGFRCGVVVDGCLAFGVATILAFTTTTAVAVLTWATTVTATLATTTFGATAFSTRLYSAFATLWAFTACRALCAGTTTFDTFWATFGAVTTTGAATTSTTAITTAIGAAAITAFAAIGWGFVA
jgi:hypothetical protein